MLPMVLSELSKFGVSFRCSEWDWPLCHIHNWLFRIDQGNNDPIYDSRFLSVAAPNAHWTTMKGICESYMAIIIMAFPSTNKTDQCRRWRELELEPLFVKSISAMLFITKRNVDCNQFQKNGTKNLRLNLRN